MLSLVDAVVLGLICTSTVQFQNGSDMITSSSSDNTGTDRIYRMPTIRLRYRSADCRRICRLPVARLTSTQRLYSWRSYSSLSWITLDNTMDGYAVCFVPSGARQFTAFTSVCRVRYRGCAACARLRLRADSSVTRARARQSHAAGMPVSCADVCARAHELSQSSELTVCVDQMGGLRAGVCMHAAVELTVVVCCLLRHASVAVVCCCQFAHADTLSHARMYAQLRNADTVTLESCASARCA